MNKKAKILIVDDREENLIVLEKLLQDLDVNIIRALSGNEALQQMLEHEFALVLMDVQMPEMDGYETVQIMRNDKNLASTPVIFISAIYKEEAYNIKGIKSGAVDFIIKPIIPEILIGKVKVFVQLFEDRKKLENLNIKISKHQDLLIKTQHNLLKAQKIAKLGNFSYDLINQKITWSDEVYKIYELSPKTDINFEKSTELIHPDDKSIFNDAMNLAITGNAPEYIDYRIICPSNKIKWIRGQSEMTYDKNDKLSLMYGTVQDITKQKTAELELEWELNVNKSLADLSKNLILPNLNIKNIADQVFIVSKTLTNSEHGYVSEIDINTKENVGHTLSDMMSKYCKIDNSNKQIAFPCGEDGIYPSFWGQSLNTGEPYLTNNLKNSSMSSSLPKGHIPIKNILSIPVKYNNEIIGQIALANTTDEYTNKHLNAIQRVANLYALAIHRKRDELEKKKLTSELQQAEKMQMIGQLAGGIAHDFNNQLATIMGNAELSLEENVDNKFVNKALNNIMTVSKRAADLTGQLLAFARKGNYLKESIDVNKIVIEVIAMLERTIDKKITIQSSLKAAGMKINGDPTQIYSAILNIAINARDAMPDGGEIIFNTCSTNITDFNSFKNAEEAKPGKYLELSITDNGTGIKESVIEKIFEPFFTTKELGKGTGMGLSAVLGIVKMHDGIIDVSSEYNSGTTFKLYFPIIDQQTEKVELKNNKLPDLKMNGTILLVDDEEMILELGKKMLSKMGLTVLTASNGEEAIQIYKSYSSKINIVIIDIIMPKIDGKEALKQILKINPKAQVIVSTGYTGESSPSDFKKLGAVDLIKKPFKYRELLSKIDDVM